MITRSRIDEFLTHKKLAFIGVSRDTKHFSDTVYHLLKKRGYTVFPINPYAERIDGDRCYPTVKALPEKVDAALIMLPPEKTVDALVDIANAGIRYVWIQQRSESLKALEFCRQHNINVIYGQCLVMFLEPLGFGHWLHRWGKQVLHTLPQ